MKKRYFLLIRLLSNSLLFAQKIQIMVDFKAVEKIAVRQLL